MNGIIDRASLPTLEDLRIFPHMPDQEQQIGLKTHEVADLWAAFP
jgi:hypothetical protein